MCISSINVKNFYVLQFGSFLCDRDCRIRAKTCHADRQGGEDDRKATLSIRLDALGGEACRRELRLGF